MYQRKPKGRYGQNQVNCNHGTSRPQVSNKVYFKGPNGWYYETKNQEFSNKKWVSKNDLKRGDFQHKNENKQKFVQKQNPQVASSSDPKNKNIDLKHHFKGHFVKGKDNENRPTCAFCNYCCKLGHISLECKFRKSSNNSKVTWVPKSCTTNGTSNDN